MIKTKLFSEYNENSLERQLNSFLHNITRKMLIDVKFSTSSTQNADHGELFSALVIYED